ncbi:MAG: sigma-70 family RNA polymerase sigma factor [Alphaproteobacteria bacterium]|nr:sigma-70 family RNA polymerase sigma factor [Alphaproteobacteria bacterium]
MPTAATQAALFHADLKAILPRLRIHALSLTHDRDRADDLVQETVIKALVGQASFRPGCFPAWMFRIQHNAFISGLRRSRPAVPLEDAAESVLSYPAHQDQGLVMQEFLAAFGKLPASQREALVLSVVDGQSYDQIARQAGVSIGTIKSRVSRARDNLERLLLGNDAEPVAEGAPASSATARRRHRQRPAPSAISGPAPS